MKYYIEMEVKGRGEFPWDMLRFGRLYPVDGESAARLDFDHNDKDARKEVRTITLGTHSDSLIHGDHTVARFQSFLWGAKLTKQERN